MRDWFLIGVFIGMIVGIIASNVPWGDSNGFHGIGWPFAYVIWDRGRDYVNFLAYIWNALSFASGLGVFAVILRSMVVSFREKS